MEVVNERNIYGEVLMMELLDSLANIGIGVIILIGIVLIAFVVYLFWKV